MIRPRVCVVDPSPETQSLIRKVLAKYCDLVFLEDGLRILDVMDIFQPDLVITDLELPSLTGFELIYMLHEDKSYRNVPIMVFSTRADLESQKQAYRLGAMNFQAKPCRPSQLFKAAALFMRLAGDEEPKRNYSIPEVERILAERARNPKSNAMLNQAVAAHQTPGRRDVGHYEHVVQATVARSRPRSQGI